LNDIPIALVLQEGIKENPTVFWGFFLGQNALPWKYIDKVTPFQTCRIIYTYSWCTHP